MSNSKTVNNRVLTHATCITPKTKVNTGRAHQLPAQKFLLNKGLELASSIILRVDSLSQKNLHYHIFSYLVQRFIKNGNLTCYVISEII